MNITPATSAVSSAVAAKKTVETPKKEFSIKSDQYDRADRYEDSREFGSGVAGLTTGATLETLDAAVKSPKLAWEIAENLWQAETIGPNLKFLGTLAAIPGAALSVVAAPFYGGFKGASLAKQASRNTEDVLPKDAAPEYANLRFNGDGEDSKSLSSRLMESLEELGSKKLEKDEKPYDIRLLSPAFAVVGSVVSAGISGVVGLVAGLGAGLLTSGKELVAGIREGKASRAIFSPVHTFAIPYGLAKEGLKEAIPRGWSDGWNHGPLKPIVDTGKASFKQAGIALKQAWER